LGIVSRDFGMTARYRNIHELWCAKNQPFLWNLFLEIKISFFVACAGKKVTSLAAIGQADN
jgi:hypothetical protein